MANRVAVDITINDRGELSIGGLSAQQLGLAPLDSQVVQTAKSLGSAQVQIQGQIITADVNGNPLIKIQWDPASRQLITDLAARYGYAISPQVLTRIEQWLASSNADITARYANGLSKPLMVNLSKPVLVDLGPQGQVTVEQVPLAMVIDPNAVQTIQQGQIRNAVLCWKQGTLTAQVDGKALPQVTLDQNGAKLLSQIFGLNLGDQLPGLFADQFGIDVSVPGGAHSTGATCGQ